MRWSIRALLHWLFRRPAGLTCGSGLWRSGCEELRRRSAGYRESGAFLLGRMTEGPREIFEFLYYDDVDETCFANGIVEFDGRKLGRVWKRCRERSLHVVADIHVHPEGFGQSPTDRNNPIIAEVGHMAIILPAYAAGSVLPGAIGIYEYLGGRRWRDHSAAGKRVFRIGD